MQARTTRPTGSRSAASDGKISGREGLSLWKNSTLSTAKIAPTLDHVAVHIHKLGGDIQLDEFIYQNEVAGGT